jgi:Arc/MetJ-type ribon-helix-helix transcriptional regulator
MPFSLRLDSKTEAMIRRLAAASGRSRSDVVREAVARYSAEADASPASGESAWDRVKVYAGVVSTGGANYSTDTHAKYRDQLRRKHRARRTR